MRTVTRILINIGLGAFLIYTLLLIILYLGLVWDKIMTPGMKNMDTKETLLFGLLAIVLVGIDFLIARFLIRQLNKRNES
jgi:hypothetical protein